MAAASDPSDARRTTVVIVDDTPDIRTLLDVSLGFEPDIEVIGQAADGAEGVAVCTALRPDVVVMDVMMPVLDGIEACAQLHALMPELRVVMYSSRVLDDTEHRSREAGASAYVEKGEGPTGVATAIRRVMAGSDQPAR